MPSSVSLCMGGEIHGSRRIGSTVSLSQAFFALFIVIWDCVAIGPLVLSLFNALTRLNPDTFRADLCTLLRYWRWFLAKT